MMNLGCFMLHFGQRLVRSTFDFIINQNQILFHLKHLIEIEKRPAFGGALE